MVYINNSLHLARKYAQIFVRGHYLFREANSFPRAKLEENCELRGADKVQMEAIVVIILLIFFATCSNELEYLNILLRTVYRQKRVERMLFSDTALSTSRFISPSVTKASRSPILTLILIVNKTRLAVFEIGEYHLGNIVGYSPVLAVIRSCEAFRPIARERKYLMDYK